MRQSKHNQATGPLTTWGRTKIRPPTPPDAWYQTSQSVDAGRESPLRRLGSSRGLLGPYSFAITTYFLNAPGQYPYVVPLCPVVACPELGPPAYASSIHPGSAPLVSNGCTCGQCAPQHMYTSHLSAPNTLIVNRFTEINYFDNPPISTSPDKYHYEMVSPHRLTCLSALCMCETSAARYFSVIYMWCFLIRRSPD